MYKVLLIDDDHDIVKANKKYLTSKGYIVHSAENGVKAIAELRALKFDCIVLDVLLPDTDGYALCEEIRSISTAPIIFLSCRDDEDDKVKGLMSGGDDYVTKPISMKELEARIHAQIRRIFMQSFHIDRENRIIHGFGCSVVLTQSEITLFLLLYDNPGTLFSTEDIQSAIFGSEKKHDTNIVAVYIRKLREKLSFLNDNVGTIETLYGEGYRFVLHPKRRFFL